MPETVSLSVNNIVEYVALSVIDITEVTVLSAAEVIEQITLNVSNSVGPVGPGVASGGVDGQILIKSGYFNYQTVWADIGVLADVSGSALSAQNFSIQRANHTGTQDVSTITGLATVATSGSYNDLINTPVLGTASSKDTAYFDLSGSAIAAQNFSIQRANHTGTQDASTITGLATVATSGSYNDLINIPTIPAAQVNSDWNSNSGVSEILNKPTLGTASSKDTAYFDLSGSAIAAQVFSIQRSNHTGTQDASTITGLAAVATSGSYNDLTNKPTLGTASSKDTEYFDLSGSAIAAQVFSIQRSNHTGTQDVSTITGLAAVATSGSYNDLTNKPTIPAAQVNSDWNSISGVSEILNKPVLGTASSKDTAYFDLSGSAIAAQNFSIQRANHTGTQDASTITGLAAVATSGSYNDLINKPVLGTASSKDTAYFDLSGSADVVENKLNIGLSTGVIEGGVITIGSPNTTFSLSDGRGIIVDSTVYPPIVTNVTWSGKTNISATFVNSHLVSYVGIDSSGNVVQSSSIFNSSQRRSVICLGSIIHVNRLNLDAINQFGEVVLNPVNQMTDLSNSLGKFNVSGNVFSPNGSNLLINKSLGHIYAEGSNWAISKTNPNITTLPALVGATFQYRFQNGTNGATGTNINPNIYDVAGVSTAVPSNKFTIQRIFSFVSNNVKIQPGQNLYNSLAEAKAAIQTESFTIEPSIEANGTLRAFLIVQQGITSLQNTSKVFFYEAGKFGSQIGIGGQSVSSLQNAYDNSITPEILTDSNNGAVSIRRGSAADSDFVLEVLNGSGNTTFSVSGNGVVSGSNLSGTNTGDQDLSPFSANNTWIGLTLGAVPTGPTVIASGEVFTYFYGTSTRYRFISSDGTQDQFYTGFDGVNLTGFVVSKGLSF